ncbi:MAG TPA: MerR family transcriptional regulator [Thermoanaerobaculia bacterium]|nr:MerR family transcriptional regulator [Thermoanaerobaculia bacterium]
MAKGEAEVYRPAEACRIAEVAPYVLRYWETEFPALSEGKDKGTAKLYTARDVKIIARIRELLYDEGFTVAGAKKRLESEIAEGRFDDGLAPAPPIAVQKAVEPRKAAPAPAPAAPRRAEAPSAPPKPADQAPLLKVPAAPREAAPARTPAAASDFDRRGVLRELKDIVKLLDRPRK